MANKKISEMTRKEKEQQEENRIAQIKTDYEDYRKRIEARIVSGENEQRIKTKENPLEVLSYENWIRKATRKDKEGNEYQIEVSGDSGETRHDRFVRLKNARMPKVLDTMDLIINLASSQYESSPEEQTKLCNALRMKVQDIENSFKEEEKKVYDY